MGRMRVQELLKEPGKTNKTPSCLSGDCGRNTLKCKIQRDPGEFRERDRDLGSVYESLLEIPNAVMVEGRQG